MRVVLGAILAFVVTFILVYAIIVTGAFGYMLANQIHDRDGGISMGIIFGLAPLCALFGGMMAAIHRYARKTRPPPARPRCG